MPACGAGSQNRQQSQDSNPDTLTAGDPDTGMCNSENIHYYKGHDNDFSIFVDTIRPFLSIFAVPFFPPTYLYTVLNPYLNEDDLASCFTRADVHAFIINTSTTIRKLMLAYFVKFTLSPLISDLN